MSNTSSVERAVPQEGKGRRVGLWRARCPVCADRQGRLFWRSRLLPTGHLFLGYVMCRNCRQVCRVRLAWKRAVVSYAVAAAVLMLELVLAEGTLGPGRAGFYALLAAAPAGILAGLVAAAASVVACELEPVRHASGPTRLDVLLEGGMVVLVVPTVLLVAAQVAGARSPVSPLQTAGMAFGVGLAYLLIARWRSGHPRA